MKQLSQDQPVSRALEPSVEFFQTSGEVIIVAYLPGVVRDEVKVEGSEKSLTVKILGPLDPQQINRMGYYSHEVVKLYGFSHTVNFPVPVDFSHVKATFKNSVLEVRIPKMK